MRMTLRLLVLVTLLASVTCLPDYSCLTVKPPQPCNLQIIYPEPIGITVCDDEYTMGADNVFANKPTLKAYVAKKPHKVVLFAKFEVYDSSSWGAIFKMDDSCGLTLESEIWEYQAPTGPLSERYVYFLYDLQGKNLTMEDFGRKTLCAVVNEKGLGQPIACRCHKSERSGRPRRGGWGKHPTWEERHAVDLSSFSGWGRSY
ncbi:uncharacterized protein LOC131945815 isoform X2 [Physella acuta]|nr:uncharacterized protein LOC131945815 isoform X2 [Physella acuta]